MIVQRQHGATPGTAEPSITPMMKKDMDALVFLIDDDPLDDPGTIQGQQLRKYVNVAHGLNSFEIVPMRTL